MTLCVDPTKHHVYFECPRCEPGFGCLEFDVNADELDAIIKNARNSLVFTDQAVVCPRGHLLQGTAYRGCVRVDDSGYPIVRNHPLWETSP